MTYDIREIINRARSGERLSEQDCIRLDYALEMVTAIEKRVEDGGSVRHCGSAQCDREFNSLLIAGELQRMKLSEEIYSVTAARDDIAPELVITAAHQAGFMVSQGHGIESDKTMPVSDPETLLDFYCALRAALGFRSPSDRSAQQNVNQPGPSSEGGGKS